MISVTKKDFVTNLLIALSYYLFWAVATVVSSYKDPDMMVSSLLSYLWLTLYLSGINLVLYLIIIPAFSPRNFHWKILSLILPGLAITVAGFYGWTKLGDYIGILPNWRRNEMTLAYIVPNTIQVIFSLAYHATIYFILAAVRLQLKNQQLVIEQRNSELNFLKSQTNPHFLFNTLNNIYSLARDKSDLTADSVMRLSEILRYMLYGAEAKRVAVRKEIEIIKEYIELEKMRYDASLQVSFQIDVDDMAQEIPPLLMIPLVENAFKHGVSQSINSPYITLQLFLQNGRLTFTIENSTNAAEGVSSENIGLRNLRRQLDLLYTVYTLTVETRGTSFYVSMTLPLSDAKD